MALKKSLAVVALVAWLIFLWVDSCYQYRVANNIKDEIWGPVSYFQPVCKWLACLVTLALCSTVIINPSGKQSTQS